jgi:hypothetical protein
VVARDVPAPSFEPPDRGHGHLRPQDRLRDIHRLHDRHPVPPPRRKCSTSRGGCAALASVTQWESRCGRRDPAACLRTRQEPRRSCSKVSGPVSALAARSPQPAASRIRRIGPRQARARLRALEPAGHARRSGPAGVTSHATHKPSTPIEWAVGEHARHDSEAGLAAPASGTSYSRQKQDGRGVVEMAASTNTGKPRSALGSTSALLLSDRGSHDDRAGSAYTRRHGCWSRHRRRRPSRISPQ